MSNKTYVKWLFADFETTGLKYFKKHNYTKVYLAGLTTLQGDFSYFFTISDFFNYLKETCSENTIIFFHNLKFDFTFLEYFFTINSIPYIKKTTELGRIIYGETSFKKLVKKGRRLVEKEITLQFRDTLLLFNDTLDNLAKSFNIPNKIKKDDDYYDKLTYKVTDDDIIYLKRDVEILATLIKMLFKKYLIAKNPPLTTASLARKILFDECIPKNLHDVLFSLNEKTDSELRPFYYGGFCYLNPKYKEILLKKVSSIDVNSFYPSIMIQEGLPFANPTVIDEYEYNPIYNYFYIIKINADLKVGCHPYLLKKGFTTSKNNYITTTDGEITVGLWDFEEDIVKKRYDIITYKYLKSYRFSKFEVNPFKDFLLKLYQNKQTTKGAEKQFNKIIINSLYGKYGQRQSNLTHIFTDFFEKETHLEEFKTISYLPLAMFITAKARCTLNFYIDMFGENFIYCDTDSVYFKGEIPQGIKIGKELGEWDLEHDKEDAIFLGQKIYKIGNMNKMVGLSKKAQPFLDFKDYKIGNVFTNINLKQKKVLGGCILVPQDFKIKNRG